MYKADWWCGQCDPPEAEGINQTVEVLACAVWFHYKNADDEYYAAEEEGQGREKLKAVADSAKLGSCESAGWNVYSCRYAENDCVNNCRNPKNLKHVNLLKISWRRPPVGGGTAFFYEWGSGLFSFTVPIIKCKSAKDWHCKNFVHEFCKFFAFFLQNRGHTINIRGKVRA